MCASLILMLVTHVLRMHFPKSRALGHKVNTARAKGLEPGNSSVGLSKNLSLRQKLKVMLSLMFYKV